MKRGSAIITIVLLATLIGIAVIDAGTERPTDWSISFDQRKKIPFGTYILHEELGNILEGKRNIRDFSHTLYETVAHLDSLSDSQTGIIEIDEYSSIYDEDVKSIINYVAKGGAVFLSTHSIPKPLADTLDITVKNAYDAGLYVNYDTTICSLVGDNKPVAIIKNSSTSFFSELPNNAKILGYIHLDGHELPNFVEVSVGKGKFLLHMMPMAFTNYHILKDTGYEYAAKCINSMESANIYWVDMYYDDGLANTPLRVILQKPGFAQAWYLLLAGLLFLLLFKSRREQRAVEIITPEPNLSREFARTIGSLYYESGEPGNILQKKIDYFLFDLRAIFQIDTLDLQNKKMIRLLASKSGVEAQEVEQLMALLIKYQQSRTPHTMEDVKRVNRTIEEFKLKANII